jgi:hypothetical protein
LVFVLGFFCSTTLGGNVTLKYGFSVTWFF